jgi:hypothetical protein
MTEKDDAIEVRDHRQPGWWWAQNEVVDDYGPRIGPYGLAVYGILARFVSNRTQKARVGVRRMAKLLGTDKEQILNALRLLEDEGLIKSFVKPGRTAEHALLDLKASVPGAGTPPDEVSAE